MKTELFFKKASENYTKAKERFDGIRQYDETDGLYRVYHHSFKMYYELQWAVVNYLNVLFELTGTPVHDLESDIYSRTPDMAKNRYAGLEEKIDSLGLDRYFSRAMKDALCLVFETNDADVWHQHQQKLTSAVYHAKVGVSAVMKVAERYCKDNILPAEETGCLDVDDALCEHIMNFPSYRWERAEDIKKRINEL
jgi:hypothetical protein